MRTDTLNYSVNDVPLFADQLESFRTQWAVIALNAYSIDEDLMSLSMYSASIPVFTRNLLNLSTFLTKAQTYSESKKCDEKNFTSARLFVDMLPLARQIQIASDVVKAAAGRLAGVELPKYEDNETTFAELQERIAKTIKFLESITAAQINGTEEKEITIQAGTNEFKFNGEQYLLGWALPNMYFHVTTAYNILRHNGLELGKSDFLALS